MLPFKLKPFYKDYIWGGTKLKEKFNKKTEFETVAESWELSAHEDGTSVICTGELKGMLFSDFVYKYKNSLGKKYNDKEKFPILVKLIDANKNLSIQVHPDKSYAEKFDFAQSKTEMWYVIDCEENAFLYFGLKKEISREEFIESIENKTIVECLKKVYVKKGDVLFIEEGTIHAIGEGILVAEIQQSSNTTYRIYDYERVGADGKKRQLHIEDAKEVAKLVPSNMISPGYEDIIKTNNLNVKSLCKCKYFSVYEIYIDGIITIEDIKPFKENSFISFLCIEGNAEVYCNDKIILNIIKGDTIFIPDNCEEIRIEGKAGFIASTL